MGDSVVFLTGFSLVHTHAAHRFGISLIPFFSRSAPHSAWLYLTSAMESLTSCVSTASSSEESSTHNMWNPMMELPLHVQIGGILELFVEEIDLARIALSCHFARDVLCDKESVHDSA